MIWSIWPPRPHHEVEMYKKAYESCVDLVVSQRVGPANIAGPRRIMHLGYMYPIRHQRSLDRMSALHEV